LPGLFVVSQVALDGPADGDIQVTIERAAGLKCERCWKYTTDTGSNPAFPTICAPCAEAVTEILPQP
jgi:isoleucyl-tRNA synthetase